MPSTALDSSRACPLPQVIAQASGICSTPGGSCLAQHLKAGAITVGAALAANTGGAGAIHRVGFFAGKPAPTGNRSGFRRMQYLWARLSCTTPESRRDHCGSGFSREHRRSRCHSPRWLQANAVPHAPMQRSPSLLATSLGGYCRKASEMAVISCVSLIGSSPGKRLPLQSTS